MQKTNNAIVILALLFILPDIVIFTESNDQPIVGTNWNAGD
jgi:hypothetical protein